MGDAHAAGAESEWFIRTTRMRRTRQNFSSRRRSPQERHNINQMIFTEQLKHIFRFHSGSPGMPELYLKNHSGFFVLFVPSGRTIINTPITDHPKPPFPSISCALEGLFGTFASQLRILARILDQDEEIPFGARFGPGNLLIVPFFLNSPNFCLIKILCLIQIS